MPKVFVHGVPENSRIWGPLVESLGALGVTDTKLLSPPAFGAPVPDGFGCTRVEYRDWLIAQLEEFDGDVDLVGHDWGAGHVLATVTERPDLVRSWTADCAGMLHPDYEWHEAALGFQAPEVGEQVVEILTVADGPTLSESLGIDPELGEALAAGLDAPMGNAMLKLYRSAVQPAMAELGREIAESAQSRALVISPSEDPYVPHALSADFTSELGLNLLTLEGAGHWWMWDRSDEVAKALVAFWAGGD